MHNLSTKIKLFLLLMLIPTLILFQSCKPGKHIQENEFLVNKVEVDVDHGKIDEDELSTVIKQKPNSKFIGFWRFKLGAYNMVDTSKMNASHEKKEKRIERKNEKKKEKVIKKNKKRIAKARKKYDKKVERFLKKGKDTSVLKAEFKPYYYYPKDYSNTFREWIRYSIGEPPVILDTNKTNATSNQMEIYLKNQGYFYANVVDTTIYDTTKKFAHVIYKVDPGKPYIVDTIIYKFDPAYSENKKELFIKHIEGNASNKSVVLRKLISKIEVGMLVNTEILDEERSRIALSLRHDAFYEANKNVVYYEVDTTLGNYKAALYIGIKKRTVKEPNGKEYQKLLTTYKISKVNFYLNDTTYYKGNFYQRLLDNGFTDVKDSKNRFYLLDTIRMFDTMPYPKVIFNGRMYVKPKVLNRVNFLEYRNWYQEYYLTRTFERLSDLGVFRNINPVVTEDFESGGDSVKVDFYLTPSKRQAFKIEPKATHSASVLGVSASISYTNKNLFRGAERLQVDFSGGFQYQPPLTSSDKENQNFGFNTYEFGPTVSLTLPTLFPFKPPKRSYPETEFKLQYNYQNRPEYKRHQSTAAISYIFYEVHKSRKHQFSPLEFKINQIETSTEFQNRINELDDEFLRNTFIDNFTLGSSYTFKFNNTPLIRKDHQSRFEFVGKINIAGNLMRLANIGKKNQDENGSYTVAGIPYSQFFRAEADFKYNYWLNKENTHSINFRFNTGVGVPYGNSPTLPFDYTFYSGGSNSVRAFPARSLGPGGFLDTINSASRIGDFSLLSTFEYRFDIISFFEGALFADIGNIWLLEPDDLRENGELSNEFFNQIAVGIGAGLRLDLSIFIFRFDVGFPLHNPALPKGGRWLWDRGEAPYDLYKQIQEDYSSTVKLRDPFAPTFNIAIGYPF